MPSRPFSHSAPFHLCWFSHPFRRLSFRFPDFIDSRIASCDGSAGYLLSSYYWPQNNICIIQHNLTSGCLREQFPRYYTINLLILRNTQFKLLHRNCFVFWIFHLIRFRRANSRTPQGSNELWPAQAPHHNNPSPLLASGNESRLCIYILSLISQCWGHGHLLGLKNLD